MWDVLTNEELLKAYRTAVMKKLDDDFIQMLFQEILRRNLHAELAPEFHEYQLA